MEAKEGMHAKSLIESELTINKKIKNEREICRKCGQKDILRQRDCQIVKKYQVTVDIYAHGASRFGDRY